MITFSVVMAAMIASLIFSDDVERRFRNRPKNSPPAQAVKAVNEAEVGWYKKPEDPEAEKRFKELVLEGSAKDDQVSRQIATARDNSSRLLESSRHKVTIVEVKIEGEFATVVTNETSHFEWSSGKSWSQKDNLHTYRLRLIESRWKVTADEFQF